MTPNTDNRLPRSRRTRFVVAAAAFLAQAVPAVAEGSLFDLRQSIWGPIASRMLPSYCNRTASCRPAEDRVNQTMWLPEPVVQAKAVDVASSLDACEDLGKLFAPETLTLCQQIAGDPLATPRQRSRAITRLGYIRQRRGDLDGFMALMVKANEADPSHIEPRLARANYLAMSNRTAEAMDEIKAALRSDANSAEAYLSMGRLQMQIGQMLAAHEAFTRAIVLGLAGHEVYFYRGRALEHSGRFIEAAEDYARAADRFDPRKPSAELLGTGDPVVHLARALYRAERPVLLVGALADVEKRLLADSEKSQLLAQRADANDKIGKLEDAARDMAAAARFAEPEMRPALVLRRSAILQRAGHTEEASRLIAEVLDLAELRTVLKIQVYLRNKGFSEVEITGTMDPKTRTAATDCFARTECTSGIARAI